jgi:hypothetical protein
MICGGMKLNKYCNSDIYMLDTNQHRVREKIRKADEKKKRDKLLTTVERTYSKTMTWLNAPEFRKQNKKARITFIDDLLRA